MRPSIPPRRDMKLSWTPHESLGPFHLGSPVETANGIATLIETPTDVDDVAQLRSFVTPDGALRLEVGADGMIASISATRSFLHGERNLIGRSLSDAQSLLGVAADALEDIAVDDGTLVIADFDALGLQLVVRDGRVAAATCY